MKANNQIQASKEVQAFQLLLDDHADVKELTKNLIELFANYSRRCLQHYQEGQADSIVNFGNEQNQLFSLMQLIAVCDADSDSPLFSELILDPSTPKPSSEAA